MQRVLGWSWLATAFCAGVHAQWTQRWDPSMAAATAQPARRAAHAMVAFEDHVYVYGGIGIDRQGDDQEFADTWAFDLENQTWSSVASANASAGPGTRFHLSGALHSNDSVGEFVIFGGVSISAATSSPVATSTGTTAIPVQQYNDVWRLSLTGQPDNSTEWVKDQGVTTDAPEPRSEAGLAVFNNQLVVFGGISYDSMGANAPVDHNDLWTYNLSDCTWTKVTPAEGSSVPPSRFSHSVSMIELGGASYLLVFSGRHLQRSSWSVLDDMWLFDFTSSKWIAVKPSAQVQRAYTSVVTIEDSMWFFGGYYRPPQGTSGFVFDDVVRGKVSVEGASATSSPSTASMDVEYGVVTSATPPLRYSHRAVLWKNCMVVFGGSYQSPRGDLWVFNTTNAATKVPLTARLPMNVETLVYVLGCFILAIILALVVLVVRWRRLDRQNMEAMRMRGARVVRGVTKERLEQLEITKYHKPAAITDSGALEAQPTAESGGCDRSTEDVCPICLIDFEDGDEIRNLPCKHIFHVPCIDEWLRRNTLCPMCKCNVDLDSVKVTIDDPAHQHAAPHATRLASAVIIPLDN